MRESQGSKNRAGSQGAFLPTLRQIVNEMAYRKMSLSNKLQAIETVLDSETQKRKSPIDLNRLRFALKIVRSVQRELFGRRFVQERTIRSYAKNYNTPSMKNFRKWKKDRAISQNKKLTELCVSC